MTDGDKTSREKLAKDMEDLSEASWQKARKYVDKFGDSSMAGAIYFLTGIDYGS